METRHHQFIKNIRKKNGEPEHTDVEGRHVYGYRPLPDVNGQTAEPSHRHRFPGRPVQHSHPQSLDAASRCRRVATRGRCVALNHTGMAVYYLRWFICDFTLTPQYFASSLSVNCHDSQFHRLPTMKFASSLSVNCHDSQCHRLPTMKFASRLSVNCHDSQFHVYRPSVQHTDCRDSLLTNSMQNIGE